MSEHLQALSIGPGLSFRFDGSPEPIRSEIERLVGKLGAEPDSDDEVEPISIGSQPPPADPAGRPSMTTHGSPLTVTVADCTLRLELPGLTSWCDLRQARGGITIGGDVQPDLRSWSRLALPRLIHELASLRGWFPVQSCAWASSGRAVALPAPTVGAEPPRVEVPAGSTWQRLASARIWFQRRATGWIVHPYRLLGDIGNPDRSSGSAPRLSSIAYMTPSLAAFRAARLGTPEALVRLVRSVDLLGLGGGEGRRFDMLTECATAVPSYRIPGTRDAGPFFSQIEGLLD